MKNVIYEKKHNGGLSTNIVNTGQAVTSQRRNGNDNYLIAGVANSQESDNEINPVFK